MPQRFILLLKWNTQNYGLEDSKTNGTKSMKVKVMVKLRFDNKGLTG